MIKNKKQYLAAKAQVHKLEETLDLSKNHHVEMDSEIYDAMIAGIESQIEDIRCEIKEYEELQETKQVPVGTLDSIGVLLIRARIACQYTQKELADKAGLKEQQIQGYEAKEYRSASLERLNLIMQALGYQAIVELANSTDRLSRDDGPESWDMQRMGTDEQDPVVSYGSEWSVMGAIDEPQWTFTSPGKAA